MLAFHFIYNFYNFRQYNNDKLQIIRNLDKEVYKILESISNNSLVDFLVLHYNAFLGIDWLIDSADKKQYHQIFIPLLISGGILLFNIALIQWRRINFLKNIMSSKDKKNKAVVDLENFFVKLILIANLMVK